MKQMKIWLRLYATIFYKIFLSARKFGKNFKTSRKAGRI